MDEQRIWAPWRIGYVTGGDDSAKASETPESFLPGADHACFLCRAAASQADPAVADRANLVIARDERVITLLNRYPYANGHLLVAPRRHVGGLHELSSGEHLAAMHLLGYLTQKMSKLLKAEGFNIGLNLGRVAGAGVPGHLHWHLVPRWQGDNNFMPTVAGTHVISQSLEALWEGLRQGTTCEGDHGP